ncbi:MAG: hypothetical protein A2Y33_01740 [Spirochaetes bacterium GWF1_51_8]|nr:MAG: hypothetical protein A2Y33_01740 [Spirochaetes bacterium GWF1_51_8]
MASPMELFADSLAVWLNLFFGVPPVESTLSNGAQWAIETNIIVQLEYNVSPMIGVKGGVFLMGDTWNKGESDEKPVHYVIVNSFKISRYEVTFHEYDKFCFETGRPLPPDDGFGRGARPVVNIDWYDAVEFCNWKSLKEGLTPCYLIDKSRKDPNNLGGYDNKKWIVSCDFNSDGYRLPTEAEWEYAARGGNFPMPYFYSGSHEAGLVGWYDLTVKTDPPMPVGLKHPNSLGLYDMSGNVWEWCWDWYGPYGAITNEVPVGPFQGFAHVIRGGSVNSLPEQLGIANRNYPYPYSSSYYIGFRIAQTLPQ